MAFLDCTLPLAARFPKGKVFREERLPVPPEALREIILNAVMHRDYPDPWSYVGIAVFDDRDVPGRDRTGHRGEAPSRHQVGTQSARRTAAARRGVMGPRASEAGPLHRPPFDARVVRSALDEVKAIQTLLAGVYKDSGDGRTLVRELVSERRWLTAVVCDAVRTDTRVDGLVAVTFTTRAAAELEGRIRRSLVGAGVFERVSRLPLAHVGN